MEVQRVNSNLTPLGNGAEANRTPVAVYETSVASVRPVVEPNKAEDTNPNPKRLQEAVDKINSSLRQNDSELEFTVDRDTKLRVVKLTDAGTGEVIMQYPSEVSIAIAKSIDDGLKQGVFLNQKA